MSGNGSNFRSRIFADKLAERGIKHHHTRPYRPQTNSKVERFNLTMADEFLHSFTSDQRTNVAVDLTAGSTATTITATTPPSATVATYQPVTAIRGRPECRVLQVSSKSRGTVQ